MAYRLPPPRVPVTVDDLTVEIQSVGAWPVAAIADRRIAAFYAADPGEPELDALTALYAYFVLEAQPTWDIEDHRGRIPPTAAGMLRLPLAVALTLISEWRATLIPKATAADEVLPEGPLRDAVNKELRKRRKKG